MLRFVSQWLLPFKSTLIGKKLGANNIDIDKCASLASQLVDRVAQRLITVSEELRSVNGDNCNNDLVTVTDREMENMLIDGLKKHFPNHHYLCPKMDAIGVQLTDDPTWIIDPIDNTTNFAHGFYCSCISVALWLNKQPELAICQNPMLTLKFTARRNQGAFLNGIGIEASGQTDLSKALILHELHPKNVEPKELDKKLECASKLMQNAHSSTGSAVMDLCMVAMGSADAFYGCPQHWSDMAGGVLLVKEAGGLVMDLSGGDILAVATHKLGRQISKHLEKSQVDEPTKSK